MSILGRSARAAASAAGRHAAAGVTAARTSGLTQVKALGQRASLAGTAVSVYLGPRGRMAAGAVGVGLTGALAKNAYDNRRK